MEEQILKAAEKLFMERGYALTSTTDIAKAAGCNQALVHYYFRNKENLFMRIFDEKIKLFIKIIFAPFPPNTDFYEMIRERIDSHFNVLLENPNLPFLVINELTTSNKDRIQLIKRNLNALPGDAFAAFQQVLNKEYEAGRIRKMIARDLILNILSLNIFAFLSIPFVSVVFDLKNKQDEKAFLLHRKTEIIHIILHSLRPEAQPSHL